MQSSELWVVLYIHISGNVVVYGLFEDEQEAENILINLRRQDAVAKCWKTKELVFYKD